MAFININGNEYEAKTNFKFENRANAKYGSDEMDGFTVIYTNMLQSKPSAVLQFWDCALAHLKDKKPTTDQIEEALEKRIEEDGTTKKVLNEAFKRLDDAAFFKEQAKFIVEQFTKAPKKQKNETDEQKKEREDREQAAKLMQERYNELTA